MSLIKFQGEISWTFSKSFLTSDMNLLEGCSNVYYHYHMKKIVTEIRQKGGGWEFKAFVKDERGNRITLASSPPALDNYLQSQRGGLISNGVVIWCIKKFSSNWQSDLYDITLGKVTGRIEWTGENSGRIILSTFTFSVNLPLHFAKIGLTRISSYSLLSSTRKKPKGACGLSNSDKGQFGV
jgi:hypothetical protein